MEGTRARAGACAAIVAPVGVTDGRAVRRIPVIALLVLALTAGSAHAIGTDLENQAAFGGYTCAQVEVGGSLLPAEWTWGITGPPRPINGCTYLATGAAAIGAPSGGAFAVAARVRVPTGSTGPMRIDVLRSTRSALGAQCCTLAAASATFVPPANATTQVPLALPMRNDLNAAFGETVDSLALTVLSRDVIVPLARGAGATGALAFHPELLPTDAGHNSSGVGAVPLLNADLVPCAGSSRCTGLALTVATRIPTLVRLAGGATLPAVCVLAGPGTCVVVATVPRLAAAVKRTTVGRGKVTLTAAGRRTVKISFAKAFRRAVAKRRRALAIRLEASATVTGPVPSSSTTARTVTVRAGR